MKKTRNALVYALEGLHYAFVNERNVRIEICFALAAYISAFVLHIQAVEWLIIILNTGFVIAAELINTAVEKLCDTISKERQPSFKIIKDVAAGAVLFAAITAFVCGLVIFIPAFIKLLNR